MYLLCIYVCPSQSVTDNPLVATKLYLYLFPWPVLASYYSVFSHFESSIQAAYASYSKTYITAATPQLDWERLSPKEIHDLSSLQGEALVYIGNPQASPHYRNSGLGGISSESANVPTQNFCTKITSCSHTVKNFNWKRLASTCNC